MKLEGCLKLHTLKIRDSAAYCTTLVHYGTANVLGRKVMKSEQQLHMSDVHYDTAQRFMHIVQTCGIEQQYDSLCHTEYVQDPAEDLGTCRVK